MRAIGNRAPTTLLETAVRVARTPDAVLANARRPLTDEQKRAIFARGAFATPAIPPAEPIQRPLPTPTPTTEPQPEPTPPAEPTPPQSGSPSGSIPGYGDPALPSRMDRPVVPGQDQPPKPTPGDNPSRPVVPGAPQPPKPTKPAAKPEPVRPVVPGQDQPPKDENPGAKLPQITPEMLERLRKRIAGEK